MVDNKQQWKAWLYLAPAIVLLLIFTVWPIINTIRMAFLEDYNAMSAVGGTTFKFGFSNFANVLSKQDFLGTLKTTVLLSVTTVPISTMLALLIAVCLNSIKPLNRLLQTIFFLPYVTNTIAIGMVFTAMFNTLIKNPLSQEFAKDGLGLINNILGTKINWIGAGSSYFHNMLVLIIYIVWNALPFKILILLGGLQSVNKQYYEAAKVDGTSRTRVFFRITVPLLSPMIAYVVITGFIGGFKEYSSLVGIFGESFSDRKYSTNDTLNTMVGYIYDSLPKGDYGKASAAALILFGLILIVTLLNLYVSKKKVHY